MSEHPTTRRDLLAIAGTMGVGLLLGTTVGCVPPPNVRVRDAREAREDHHQGVAQTLQILKGRPPLSLEGLSMLVDSLVETEVITQNDGELLKKVLRAIFESEEVARIVSTVVVTYEELTDEVGEVAAAIIGIVRDSVDWVQDAAASITLESAICIVAKDMYGALNILRAAHKLGGIRFAVTFAILGALVTSAEAITQPKIS